MSYEIKDIPDIDLQAILSDSKFGTELEFTEILEKLSERQEIFNEFEEYDFGKKLSQAEIDQINSFNKNIVSIVNQIESFSLDQNNPKQARDKIIHNLNNYYNKIVQIRPSLNFLRWEKQEIKDFKKTEKEYKKRIVLLDNKIEELQNKKEQVANKSGNIWSTILSKYFGEQVWETSKVARQRLVGAGIFFLIWVVVAVWYFFILEWLIDIQGNPKWDEKKMTVDTILFVQWSVIFWIFFSLSFYGLNFCSRKYNIRMNNSAQNKHREIVGKTLADYLESVPNDKDARQDMIKEAALAMFENKSTWYLSKEPNNINSPIIEMINKVVEKP